MGAAFMIAGMGAGVASFLGMASDPTIFPLFAVMGAAFFLSSRLTVPRWAQMRSRQFEDIIARLIHRIDAAVIESGDPPPRSRLWRAACGHRTQECGNQTHPAEGPQNERLARNPLSGEEQISRGGRARCPDRYDRGFA